MMEQVRHMLGTIAKNLGDLSATQRLLLGTLAVAMVLTLIVVSQFSSRVNRVEFMGSTPPEERRAAIAKLQEAGYEVQEGGDGKAYVRPDQVSMMMAKLGENGALPSNTPDLIDSIASTPSWLSTRGDKHAAMVRARERQIAQILSHMSGIQKALVMLDVPDQIGFGQSLRQPTATVSVTPRGEPITQARADTIARTVASAVAGLAPERVVVSDASTTRSFRVQSEDDLGATTYLDQAKRIEQLAREKILNHVAYLPGVVVEVKADVDASRVNSTIEKALPIGEGTVSVIKKQTENTQNQMGPSVGGEPGVGANLRTDVSRSGAGGERNESRQEDSEFEVLPGRKVDRVVDPRGMATKLVASVTIPRPAILEMLKQERGAPAGAASAPAAAGAGAPTADAPPTEPEVRARFEAERTNLAQIIKPLLDVRLPDGAIVEGVVSIAMVSGVSPMGLGVGMGGVASGLGTGLISTGSGSGGGSGMLVQLLGSGMIETGVVAVLGVASLGMMLLMVRKASKKLEIPTPEELVGLPPPKLDAGEDVVGEADEGDAPMAGIEIDDEQLKVEKMRESVSSLIKTKPDQAAKLLNRWIAVEE
jgi:flagellar biosynthesis/type III secretory pathway M-ring protein FliF/YscJ